MNPEIENLKRRLEVLEKSSSINRNLDNQSKDILGQIISNKIIDIVWSEYYYYYSAFESISRYTPVTFGTEVWEVGTSGLHLGTDAVNNSEVSVMLDLISTNTLKPNKETRFRFSTKVSSVTATNFIVSTMTDASAQNGISFRLLNGTIYGVSDNNGTETTFNLGTYSANTIVTLEYRYFPAGRIEFYVDGVNKGGITSNLPSISTLIRNMVDIGLATTEAVAKNSYTQYFEFIQQK